jgi:hypothetical protein
MPLSIYLARTPSLLPSKSLPSSQISEIRPNSFAQTTARPQVIRPTTGPERAFLPHDPCDIPSVDETLSVANPRIIPIPSPLYISDFM